jgi:hypothetical protein
VTNCQRNSRFSDGCTGSRRKPGQHIEMLQIMRVQIAPGILLGGGRRQETSWTALRWHLPEATEVGRPSVCESLRAFLEEMGEEAGWMVPLPTPFDP